ncbi:TonB-dependent receptor [Gynuella sp.]|uniref:TonB-dependent receptor n=1 Tax=Gynuella sp. TaxID=2969146 RepID=UPI003D0ECEF5
MSKTKSASGETATIHAPALLALAIVFANGSFLPNMAYADEDSINLDTLIVTGEKVNKSAKKTTTGVTVLTGDVIGDGDKKDVADVVTEAPNVISSGSGATNIRGVDGGGAATGVVSFISGSRPRVSTSIDGIAESWAGYMFVNGDLWDVEQVEVLRGPQSTNQGRNSIGGSIVVQTKDPSFDWEAGIRGGFETANDHNRYQLAGMLSGPIIDDELAFRLAIDGLNGNGYIDYDYADGTDKAPWDPSEQTNINVRGKLLWEPDYIAGLSAKLTVNHREAEGEYLNFVNNFDGHKLSDYTLTMSDYTNTRYQDSEVNSFSTDIDYAFNDALSNVLSISYSDYHASFEVYPDNWPRKMDLIETSTTLENRVVYAPAQGHLSGMVGFYLYNSQKDLDVLIEPTENVFNDLFTSDDETTTLAIFGEMTYNLLEPLDLILGARLENERQDRDFVASAWQDAPTIDAVEDETMFLPKIGLTYAVSADTVLGLTARKGYNAGGATLNSDDEYYTFDKEEVWTYEFSTRSTFLDNRLNVSTNTFYNQYKDYQALSGIEIENIPEGYSYGFEAEVRSSVTPTLEVYETVGLLKSLVTKSTDENPEWKKNEFNYAPSINFGLGLKKYLGLSWSAGLDANYVGEYYSTINNDEDRIAGDYTVVDLNLTYSRGNITVGTYVNNLFNERVTLSQSSYSSWFDAGYQEATLGAPRTIGMTVEYKM